MLCGAVLYCAGGCLPVMMMEEDTTTMRTTTRRDQKWSRQTTTGSLCYLRNTIHDDDDTSLRKVQTRPVPRARCSGGGMTNSPTAGGLLTIGRNASREAPSYLFACKIQGARCPRCDCRGGRKLAGGQVTAGRSCLRLARGTFLAGMETRRCATGGRHSGLRDEQKTLGVCATQSASSREKLGRWRGCRREARAVVCRAVRGVSEEVELGCQSSTQRFAECLGCRNHPCLATGKAPDRLRALDARLC